MIFKIRPFIRELVPYKNLGLWGFPWLKSEKLTGASFLSDNFTRPAEN
jgi:hypothetical protein